VNEGCGVDVAVEWVGVRKERGALEPRYANLDTPVGWVGLWVG
jgi:hypothetical protein